MTNITITNNSTFTYDREAVKAFAIDKGWKEKITPEGEIYAEEIDNPETLEMFIQKDFDNYLKAYVTPMAIKIKNNELNRLVEEYRTEIEPTLHEQIVKPVEDALISEIVIV